MATSQPKKLTTNQTLEQYDSELWDIIEKEKYRQWRGLELIASENFTSRAVLDALSSPLTNKYSEGQPGARFYGGNEFIDEVEVLCKKRCLQAYELSEKDWDVNVQAYSGSTANFAILTALIKPNDRVMGLDIPSGGHLTHGGGFKPEQKLSATSIYFDCSPYSVNEKTGYIDYDELEKKAREFKPHILICGASSYPRDWDFARIRKLADEIGCYLWCDMAHISGLVAGKQHSSPFEHCDVVSSTTHKSLAGPRSSLIFSRRDKGLPDKINFAVFPQVIGGPHNHQIAAVATQMKYVMSDEFKQYAKQVVLNAKAIAGKLTEMGYKIATGGTDNHLVLWDLRPHGISGPEMETFYDLIAITLNKNFIAGDNALEKNGGVRVGTPAMTSRGLKEEGCAKIVQFLHEGLQLALKMQKEAKEKSIDFETYIKKEENQAPIKKLRNEVEEFSKNFAMPGFDIEKMKYHSDDQF